jgi:hypothetical protein
MALVAPGDFVLIEASDSNPRAKRARDVIALGWTIRSQGCTGGGSYDSNATMQAALNSGLDFPIAYEIAQASDPAQQALQNNTAVGPSTVAEAQSGAALLPSDFSDAPNVVPMNTTEQTNPAPSAVAERRRVRRARASRGAPDGQIRSVGVEWGGLPVQRPGGCGPQGSALDVFKSNPLAAILIVSGLGVIVYAAVKK